MTFVRRGIIVLLALAALGAGPPAPPHAGSVRDEVRQFLQDYIEAQNELDATAVMDMVSRRPEASSIAMGKVTRTWEKIRDELDATVGTEGEMKLLLGTIDVVPLGPGYALAYAPCTVTLPDQVGGGRIRGAVSVVVEKSQGKWRVLHEHSSAQVVPDEEGE